MALLSIGSLFMVEQKLRNVMMAFTPGDSLGRKLPNASTQTDISTCRHQGSDNWQKPVAGCDRERRVESVILLMNIWISPGREQGLNRLGVPPSRSIHKGCVMLCR